LQRFKASLDSLDRDFPLHLLEQRAQGAVAASAPRNMALAWIAVD
jgi:hypothetical protein